MHSFPRKNNNTAMFAAFLGVLLLLGLSGSSGWAFIYGDVNNDGAVDVHDVVLVIRHALGQETLGGSEQVAADVNADGAVDVRDAALLMRRALGIIDTFPALNHELEALLKNLIVEDGLAPGKKLVVVILDVPDQGRYLVKFGDRELEYRESVGGFRGEVFVEDIKLSNLDVVAR